MIRCKAIRDGLIGVTYIHAGDEFLIDKCPRWAVVVKKPAVEPVKPDAKEKAGA